MGVGSEGEGEEGGGGGGGYGSEGTAGYRPDQSRDGEDEDEDFY